MGKYGPGVSYKVWEPVLLICSRLASLAVVACIYAANNGGKNYLLHYIIHCLLTIDDIEQAPPTHGPH